MRQLDNCENRFRVTKAQRFKALLLCSNSTFSEIVTQSKLCLFASLDLFANKTKPLASPDRSGILFLAPLARKRFSGWQERQVLKTLKFLLLKNLTIRECVN